YLIRNNQAVAVDAETAAAALTVLIEDKAKRLSMGQSGRQRAEASYDWRVIIKAYEDLWEEQAAKRKNAKAAAPKGWNAVHPSYPDPSSMFAGFPSALISERDGFEVIGGDDDITLAGRHPMNVFGMDMLLPEEEIGAVLKLLSSQPGAKASALQQAMKASDSARLQRTLAWLMKMGLIRRRAG
ncbi:MAG TPA: hypothetical protein VHB73_03125, partial [Alphaproteobacteria bacterium]|nr:hypothetical protein [Alphaproteobacteria bacterium]